MLQNFVTTKAGLTGLSGAATTFTTAAAIIYALFGKAYSKAAVAGGATPTVDAVTGLAITVQPGFGTTVLWCVDASGTIKVVQGGAEIIDTAGAYRFAAPQFPALDDGLTPFAYSVHKVLPAGAAWTFGVSNWNTANTVHTATDLLVLPSRPQST